MTEVIEPRPMSVSRNREEETTQRGQTLLAAGGLLAALGASSCCILPLALFSVGVSGAWISNLTALAPYQPVLLVAALAFLGFGFWRAYRQPNANCADGSACARPMSSRMTKIGLWTAALFVIAAAIFPYLATLVI